VKGISSCCYVVVVVVVGRCRGEKVRSTNLFRRDTAIIIIATPAATVCEGNHTPSALKRGFRGNSSPLSFVDPIGTVNSRPSTTMQNTIKNRSYETMSKYAGQRPAPSSPACRRATTCYPARARYGRTRHPMLDVCGASP